MAIADGRTTLEKVRAGANERQRVHRAKSESVTSRTPDPVLSAIADGTMGDCEACIIAAREPEREAGGAEISTEERRAQNAALVEGGDPEEDSAGFIVAVAGNAAEKAQIAIRNLPKDLTDSETARIVTGVLRADDGPQQIPTAAPLPSLPAPRRRRRGIKICRILRRQ